MIYKVGHPSFETETRKKSTADDASIVARIYGVVLSEKQVSVEKTRAGFGVINGCGIGSHTSWITRERQIISPLSQLMSLDVPNSSIFRSYSFM